MNGLGIVAWRAGTPVIAGMGVPAANAVKVGWVMLSGGVPMYTTLTAVVGVGCAIATSGVDVAVTTRGVDVGDAGRPGTRIEA
ncbi:MAG TPA: hypothetical protein VD948_08330, partial [Rhodothermales bacterium]|nr:hypothetical protein [Rhodothermales bacterium]